MKYLAAIVLLSGCGRGVHFDLSQIDDAIQQKHTLIESEKIVNEIFQGECFKLQLNEHPEVYEDFKNSSITPLVGIYPQVTEDHAAATNGGGKISLTWGCFSNKQYLVGVLVHEISHYLGYDHPVYTDPHYDESIPQITRHAAIACMGELKL